VLEQALVRQPEAVDWDEAAEEAAAAAALAKDKGGSSEAVAH